ncbi:MAG: SUF system Fe-S cluster assembly protein [Pseudomonadota bacterium]
MSEPTNEAQTATHDLPEHIAVQTAQKPPRARVSDVIDEDDAPAAEPEAPRQRDYLDGFLAATPGETPTSGAGGELQSAVVDALREIYDPEIPVNIYDLGLIYGVEVDEDSDVTILMTLTTPHCPVAETMPGEVELRASSVPGIRDAEVELVWDPPWSPEKMSDEARLELGML